MPRKVSLAVQLFGLCFVFHPNFFLNFISLALCAMKFFHRKLAYESLERFVTTFERGWDKLISWYLADWNEEKVYQWTCYAADHGDLKHTVAAARFVLCLFVWRVRATHRRHSVCRLSHARKIGAAATIHFASMAPYEAEPANLLMAYRSTTAFYPSACDETVLQRIGATRQYPITELHIRLPQEQDCFQSLLLHLNSHCSVRHISVRCSSHNRVQEQALLERLASLPPMLSLCIDSVSPIPIQFPSLYRTQHSLSITGIPWQHAAQPKLEDACTHLSELRLSVKQTSHIEWSKLLVHSSNLRVLTVDVACQQLLEAVKLNTSLCRLAIEKEVDIAPVLHLVSVHSCFDLSLIRRAMKLGHALCSCNPPHSLRTASQR
jgi:hypothetical protein